MPTESRRVALVASSYAPYVGGVEEHVRQTATEMSKRGHAVEVWTVQRGGDNLPRLETLDGIAVRRLPTPLPNSSWRGSARFLTSGPTAAAAWHRATRTFRPHLLHVHCFGPNGVYAKFASDLTGIPLIVSLHGETFMDDHDAFTHSRILRFGLRRALSSAATVTGCSQVTLDDAVRFGLPHGQGEVVFNGVDLDESTESHAWDPPFDRYVLAVGRVVHNKGFDLLLDAYARIAADHHPGLGLLIAGDGPERESLAVRAAELGLGDRVSLPGHADRASVAAAMAHADILVVPSRIEPFGIVVLEGWRAGLPVIASSRGGTREFVRSDVDGLLIDPLDTDALAVALDRLAADASLRARLGSAGSKRATDFTVSKVVDRYEAIYRRTPSKRW